MTLYGRRIPVGQIGSYLRLMVNLSLDGHGWWEVFEKLERFGKG